MTIAQYFPTADHIVVLGDHGIVDQGSWQNLNVRVASIAKFGSNHMASKENGILSANYNKLSAQLLAKDATEQDLARQTGDTTLYSCSPPGLPTRAMLTDHLGYYLSFSDLANVFHLVSDTSIYSFCMTIPQYWLRLWTESGDNSTAFYVGGYVLLSTISWITTSAQAWYVSTLSFAGPA